MRSAVTTTPGGPETMAATFNSPPGWPTPPDGWTPPPGWQPDPSWPAAPEGWQFWTDDGTGEQPSFGTASTPQDSQPTQHLGHAPTQAMPGVGSGVYSYAPSAGLDQPGPSPYAGPGGGGYPQPGGGGPYAGGPPPGRSNRGVVIGVSVAVAAVVLGGIGWGVFALVNGPDDDPSPSVTATTDPPETDPSTDPPTTDPSTEPPSTDPSTDSGGGGDVADLTGDDPALALGASGEPVAELRLQEIVTDWQPDDSMFCGEPTNGQYLGLQFEITTLPALADEETPTYTFIGWEVGAEVDGVRIDANGFSGSLMCLSSEQQAPSEMQPNETYTGWIVLDVPDSVTAVVFDDLFDFSGEYPTYRWLLADQ